MLSKASDVASTWPVTDKTESTRVQTALPKDVARVGATTGAAEPAADVSRTSWTPRSPPRKLWRHLGDECAGSRGTLTTERCRRLQASDGRLKSQARPLQRVRVLVFVCDPFTAIPGAG